MRWLAAAAKVRPTQGRQKRKGNKLGSRIAFNAVYFYVHASNKTHNASPSVLLSIVENGQHDLCILRRGHPFALAAFRSSSYVREINVL